jgi:hypothetical protein
VDEDGHHGVLFVREVVVVLVHRKRGSFARRLFVRRKKVGR